MNECLAAAVNTGSLPALEPECHEEPVCKPLGRMQEAAFLVPLLGEQQSQEAMAAITF